MKEVIKKYEGKKIAFCVPGCRFSRQFISNICELILFLNKNKIETALSQFYSPEIHQVRAHVAGGHHYKGLYQSPFSQQFNYDYLMWVDSDMNFTIQDFIDLLEMDKNLCTGWYYQADELPAVGYFNKTLNKITNKTLPFDVHDRDNIYTFSNAIEIVDRDAPYIVDWAGMGWMLMKRGVMELVKYPWFAPKIVRFNISEGYEVMSEDLSFAMSLKEVGVDMWVNPRIKLGHEKIKVF